MPVIQFALAGPPFSVNNRGGGPKQKKNYRTWINAVRAEASRVLAEDHDPVTSDTTVTIAYYYPADKSEYYYRDIDNIIKPILDALGEISVAKSGYKSVWIDDSVVNRLLVHRYKLLGPRLGLATIVTNAPGVLSDALSRYEAVVYVRIKWTQI